MLAAEEHMSQGTGHGIITTTAKQFLRHRSHPATTDHASCCIHRPVPHRYSFSRCTPHAEQEADLYARCRGRHYYHPGHRVLSYLALTGDTHPCQHHTTDVEQRLVELPHRYQRGDPGVYCRGR